MERGRGEEGGQGVSKEKERRGGKWSDESGRRQERKEQEGGVRKTGSGRVTR